MNSMEIESIVSGPQEIKEANSVVDADGWIYDSATGEVLGRENLDGRFAIDSEESANWALKLRVEIETKILALDAQLRVLSQQIDALRNAQVRRLAWWDWRFRSELIQYARKRLEGRKERTAKFIWGNVAFRKCKGATTILDHQAAVDYVKTWCPERVKVKESVSSEDVKHVMDILTESTGNPQPKPNWLVLAEPREEIKIETGMDVEAKGKK